MQFVSNRAYHAFFCNFVDRNFRRAFGVSLTLASGAVAWKQAEKTRCVRCSSTTDPWVPSTRNPKVLEVLLVRHGESENNVTMREVYAEHERLGSDLRTREMAFLALKKDDPSLSPKGFQQAEAFAAIYAEDLKRRGCIIYSSPLLRTLQTAKPTAERLQVGVVVHPDIFECGGVYKADDQGTRRTGKCLSGQNIQARFPSYDVSALPLTEQWYAGGWESDSEARARFAKVAQWLKSDDLRANLDGKIMVVVCHGHMIDMLLKALSDRPDDGKADLTFANNHSGQTFFYGAGNTATVRLTIKANGNIVLHTFGDMSHLRASSVSAAVGSNIGGLP